MNKDTNKMKYVSGTYKKHFPGREEEYESFMPSPVNRECVPQDKRILVLLKEATQHVGELKELARRTLDIDTFIRMHEGCLFCSLLPH